MQQDSEDRLMRITSATHSLKGALTAKAGCTGTADTKQCCFSWAELCMADNHAALHPSNLSHRVLQMRWSEKARGKVSWIAFVYRRHGQLVNVKYRSMNKEFMQVQTSSYLCA